MSGRKLDPTSVLNGSQAVCLWLLCFFVLTFSACGKEETGFDRELHQEIRTAFRLPAGGEVLPDELSQVIRATVQIEDTLDTVKEKMSVFELEEEPWCSISWDRYLDIWGCEIITDYGRGVRGEQSGVALLFYFDEARRLSRFEVMPFSLRKK